MPAKRHFAFNSRAVAPVAVAAALAIPMTAAADFQPLTEATPLWGQPGGITGVDSGHLELVFGTSGVAGTVTLAAMSGDVRAGDMPAGWSKFVGTNIFDYLTEAPNPGPQIPLITRVGASQTMQVAFDPPVIAPYLHVTGLDGSKVTIGAPLTVVTVSKNDAMVVSGNTLNTVAVAPIGDGCNLNDSGTTPNARCGTFMLEGGPVSTASLLNESHGSRGDGWNSSWSFPLLIAQKGFGAPVITSGASTTLTITITNPTPGELSDMDFTDVLPTGLSLANGNVDATGCGSPSFGAPASLDASGIAIEPNGTCTLSYRVTGNAVGSHTFSDTAFGANAGNLLAGPEVTLEIVAAPAVTPVPTLGEWALLLMSGMFGMLGLLALRRRG